MKDISAYKKLVWKLVLEECEKMMQEDLALVMYTDAKVLFEQNFDYYYFLMLNKFMISREESLDRHKIVSAAICAILQSSILGIAKEQEKKRTLDDVFLGNEKIALNIALSLMYQLLRQDYSEGRLPYDELISNWVFPKPLSCNRDYTEVICRDLYYAKHFFGLDPLSIANFMFFIEAYSFEASSIKMNEQKWDELSNRRQEETLKMEVAETERLLSDFDERFQNERRELEERRDKLNSELNQMK